MAGIDVHQHLWPRAFTEALAQRAEAPISTATPARFGGGVGRRSPRSRARDQARPARPPRDRHRGRLAAAVARARGARAVRADSLIRSGRTGSSSSPPKRPAGSLPLAVGRPRDGFAGVSIGAARLDDLERSGADARRAAGTGSALRAPGPGRPARLRAGLVAGRRRLHEPDAARLLRVAQQRPGAVAGRYGRVRDPRRRRADPARAARLAWRRRALLAPPERVLRHRVVRPARARAVHRDLRRRAARLRHDAPVVDPTPRFAPSMRSASPSRASSVRTT